MTAGLPSSIIAQRGLLLGLGWLSEHLPHFSVLKRNQSDQQNQPNHPFTKGDVARLKPISELALTLWVLHRCGLQVPFLGNAVEWIWQECEQGRKLIALLLARNDFLPCCALYAPLYQLGYRSEILNRVLDMLARSEMASALPLQPWSRLAMRYNLWQLGLSRRPGGRRQGLYIEARPEPWVVSGEIAYAITHEVFYMTDFGFHAMENEEIADYLRIWVPYWARHFAAERDDDLTAEFAMVSSCLSTGSDGEPSTHLLSVLEHQLHDGSVAGPEGAGSFLFADDDTPARRQFLGCYHTTLVTLMAAAMALRVHVQRTGKHS